VSAREIDDMRNAFEGAFVDGVTVDIPLECFYVTLFSLPAEVSHLISFFEKDFGKVCAYKARTTSD
jgi:hypothetical protein